MTRKFVKVTMLTTIFSEAGEKKIQPKYSKKDQHGLTVEQYEDMNIPIPDDSTHNTIDDESEFLDDMDLDTVPSVTFFDAEDFLMVAEHLDFGSTIYLRTGHVLDVAESPRQIINKINKLNK
jgi:hypothetical protein